MRLKLKEVLWEVTNKCNRNCPFCGSKEVMNCGDDATAEDRINIAQEIAKNSDRVTLTGGEPLLIRSELPELKKIFDEHNCAIDVVTNGDNIFTTMDIMFENIGISINSIEDVSKINWEIANNLNCNTVIIMNINKINFFDIEEILTSIPTPLPDGLRVQFQLTMYKGKDDLMIDGDGINSLRDVIHTICSRHNIEYVFADNLQAEHECSAGISSCGVQFNGNVVYCLSERSWLTTERVMGNLHSTSLKSIWENTFKENRFDDNFECCRTCFKYTDCKDSDEDDVKVDEEKVDEFFPWKGGDPRDEFPGRDVALYGVFQPPAPLYPKEALPSLYSYGVADRTYFSNGSDNNSGNSSNIS